RFSPGNKTSKSFRVGMNNGPPGQQRVECVAYVVNGHHAARLAERGVLVVDAAAVFDDTGWPDDDDLRCDGRRGASGNGAIGVDDRRDVLVTVGVAMRADMRRVDRHVL